MENVLKYSTNLYETAMKKTQETIWNGYKNYLKQSFLTTEKKYIGQNNVRLSSILRPTCLKDTRNLFDIDLVMHFQKFIHLTLEIKIFITNYTNTNFDSHLKKFCPDFCLITTPSPNKINFPWIKRVENQTTKLWNYTWIKKEHSDYRLNRCTWHSTWLIRFLVLTKSKAQKRPVNQKYTLNQFQPSAAFHIDTIHMQHWAEMG